MEESAMKGVKLNGSSSMCKICVKGYPTSLREYDLRLALRKHFASCGEITHVNIPRDYNRGILKRRAYISIWGKGAEEKALKLSGSDVGGWTVIASKGPPPQDEDMDSGRDTMKKAPIRKMIVTGYDTSLPVVDIKFGLSKYFSSCGDIQNIIVPNGLFKSKAVVSIMGEGAVEKAQALSGSEVQGWKIDVLTVFPEKHVCEPVGFSPLFGFSPLAKKARIL